MPNSSDESRPRPRPQPSPAPRPAEPPPPAAEPPPPLTPPLVVPAAESGPRSRRWFLAGGAVVVLGAGAGVAAEFARNDHAPDLPPIAPGVLVTAAAAERALIADLDATTGGSPEVRRVIAEVRADHAAHLAALTDLLARYRRQPDARSSSPVAGRPRTLAQLNAAERAASSAAAEKAAATDAALAAMLASIAACEATHAEVLR